MGMITISVCVTSLLHLLDRLLIWLDVRWLLYEDMLLPENHRTTYSCACQALLYRSGAESHNVG